MAEKQGYNCLMSAPADVCRCILLFLLVKAKARPIQMMYFCQID